MANWSLPTITDLYTNFLAYLKSRDDDAGRMNDTRVAPATNVPEYSKRWNDTTKTVQNWLSSAWSNLVIGIAGGGTGATTAAAARTNLDVYSKAEAVAAFAVSLTTVSATQAGDVPMPTAYARYDGPSVSLAAGTWLVIAEGTVYQSSPAANVEWELWDGVVTRYAYAYGYPSGLGTGQDGLGGATLTAIVTLGATTTVKLTAKCSVAGGASIYSYGTSTNIRAVKIA